jgi:uncharacterized protein (DUF58 family)
MLAAIRKQFNFQEWSYRLLSKFLNFRESETLPIEIHRKRVYILPTRFGIFFGIFLFITLLGSLNYNNNMALMLTFLLGGLALLSPLYTVRNLAGLQVVQISAPPVFAGDPAHFVMTLLNPSSTVRPVIWAQGEDDMAFTEAPGNGRAELEVCFPTEKRGWLTMGRTRVFTTYPVGMFHSWAWLVPEVRCLVYPRPERSGPPLPRGDHPALGQPERAGDEEWAGLRDYQLGDPSRLIAWKVVARTDQMVTKTFADHQSEELRLDYSKLGELDVEARLSRLTRWLLEAHGNNLKYSLNLPNTQIGPASGDEHKHLCLKALAEFNA